jgi:sulfate/thiosulfate transport system permease protein
MAVAITRAPAAREAATRRPLGASALAATFLSLVVLIPLAALLVTSAAGGPAAFWSAATDPEAVAAIELTLGLALVVAAVNALVGTAIAWELERDHFVGRRLIDSLIDLPFALPTIVAGLTLLALYGPHGVFGVDVAYTRVGIVLALLFVTLPFVVRSVQPVLAGVERDAEEAAGLLGASRWAVLRRIVLPQTLPAILSGTALAFARAVGEFGAVVLISGNLPFRTEVASVFISSQVASYNVVGGSAVSVVLLALSLAVLLAVRALESRSANDHG